ncbi:MAG: hypothetical protein ACRDJE_24145 [Dehalococcoidia bacterium]
MTTPPHHVAARCVADPAYALAILDGEDYPEVREAILADLQEELGDGVDRFLNPQPIPPGIRGWSRLTLLRLRGLAVGRAAGLRRPGGSGSVVQQG